MKKMILSTAALLTIVSLAACSNKQDTKKETSNSDSPRQNKVRTNMVTDGE